MTFSERMNELMAKGISTSKEALSKAGAQAQAWGEMGVLKVEIFQLRSQSEKLSAQLGAEVYAAFAERGETNLPADSPKIRNLVLRIGDLEKAIDSKEMRFRELGGKDSDLEGEKPSP